MTPASVVFIKIMIVGQAPNLFDSGLCSKHNPIPTEGEREKVDEPNLAYHTSFLSDRASFHCMSFPFIKLLSVLLAKLNPSFEWVYFTDCRPIRL